MSPARKNRLPKPALQLKLVLGFMGVSTLALCSQVLLLANRLMYLSQELPVSGEEIRSVLPELLTEVFVFSFLVLLPSVLAIGVLLTFRLAGPIYRFERYLADVAAGRESGPCRLRKGDQLQELCDLINAALEARPRRLTEKSPADGATGEIRRAG
ncbi:MAG: hypothetical protein HOP15_09340 [Planctomycetes bacterium]|nr:hypothetical protein [Planctomycetota bacterium]